jgi:IclR family transcriptional regulator, KDG regulon repressor
MRAGKQEIPSPSRITVGAHFAVPEGASAMQDERATPDLSTVRNALRVIDAFSEHEPMLGVMEISRRLKISKSAVSRLVTTLCSQGILTVAPSGHYRLGARLYDIGLVAVRSHQLFNAASEALAALHAATGKSVHFSILDGLDVVQIHRLTSKDMARMPGELRTRPPAHATSTGKAILAFAKEELVERALSAGLRSFTRTTITDAAKLRNVLATVRAHGYALSKDEFMQGVGGVSAPVLDKTGVAVAALTIVDLSDHMTDKVVSHDASLLMRSARELSAINA